MGFLKALRFLTIIPVPEKEKGNPLAYFPLVGLLLGLMLCGLNYGLGLVLPQILVNALLILFMIFITGGLHIEGFMDTCDGVFSLKGSPGERLKIMSDPHVGGFAVIGVLSLLLAKYASLASLPKDLRARALLIMPVMGRWAMVYVIFSFKSAKREGLGYYFKKQARWQEMALATAITLSLAIASLKIEGVLVMGVIWLTSLLIAYFLCSKLGGLNGDAYGAINEIAEVLTLFFLPLIDLGVDKAFG